MEDPRDEDLFDVVVVGRNPRASANGGGWGGGGNSTISTSNSIPTTNKPSSNVIPQNTNVPTAGKKNRTWMILAGVVAVVSLVVIIILSVSGSLCLSGNCDTSSGVAGGEGGGGSGEGNTGGSNVFAPGRDSQSTLEMVQASGKLRCGVSSRPLLDVINGEQKGFTVDLVSSDNGSIDTSFIFDRRPRSGC